MRRIGVSLPFAFFSGVPAHPAQTELLDAYGGLDALLGALAAMGVASVELRAVTSDASARTVADAAALVRGHGLELTIHGALYPGESARAFANPYRKLTGPVTVTVHALGGAEETVRAIRGLTDGRLKLALENNRRRGEPRPGSSCDGVLRIVRELPDAGICWDMGHYYYNTCTHHNAPDAVPTPEFLSRVIHTHIHGLVDGSTHFPCLPENLPLTRYLRALGGYEGVYNIELDFPRFHGRIPARGALEMSVAALREALGIIGEEVVT